MKTEKKERVRHVRRCRVFTANIGEDQKKKKKKKKRSPLFVMRPLIFSEALGFSLLSLLVNPALLQGVSRNFLRNEGKDLCHIKIGFLRLHLKDT